MSLWKKVVFSLLISTAFFTAGIFFFFTGGFDFLEVQFYEPRIIDNIHKELRACASDFTDYYNQFDGHFSAFVQKEPVTTFIDREVSEENNKLREDFLGRLFSEYPGLLGARLIEKDGFHIHYSTFPEDRKRMTSDHIAYDNYANRGLVPYSRIEAVEGRSGNLYFDSEKNLLLFSYPFFDKYTAYRGTFVFYVSGDDFTRWLVSKGRVSLNKRASVVSPAGFLFDVPVLGRDEITRKTGEVWGKKFLGLEKIIEGKTPAENVFIVTDEDFSLADKIGTGIKMGRLCTQDMFEFSKDEKTAILACLGITFFLVVFLLFNIRHDRMVLIRRRIKKFQYELLREYLDRKDDRNWQELAKEISQRRGDVNIEVKRSLPFSHRKYAKEIDELLDESWRDVIRALGGATFAAAASVVVAEQKPVVEKAPALQKTPALPETQPVQKTEVAEEIPEAEPVEEIAELEEVEELEEIPEAEPVEDIAELEEVEELEEIPEAEPVEDIAELEEVEELEEIPEAEPVEDIAELEEVEELEEIPEAEPIEDIAELEEVEELEEIPEAEPIEEVTVPVQENDDIEEISELEEVGEFTRMSDVHLADAVHAIEGEELEELEELEEVEELEPSMT